MLLVVLLFFASCTKERSCDVPGQSTHLRWNLETCTSVETATSQTIVKDHETICDCEDHCEGIARARENTLRIYQNILDTTSNKALRVQTEKDKYYLEQLPDNCNCK